LYVIGDSSTDLLIFADQTCIKLVFKSI